MQHAVHINAGDAPVQGSPSKVFHANAPVVKVAGGTQGEHLSADNSAAGWKTPRIEIESGHFTVRAATQTIHRVSTAQQSGVRASPVQGPVRRRGLAPIRNATSTALRAASHLAPAEGFHVRGRCLEIMVG